jgi:hypothetical protein
MHALVEIPLFFGFLLVLGGAPDDPKLKFADAPAPVQSTMKAEAQGAKIEFIDKEKDDDDVITFWADAVIGGKTYAIGVLEDGTLTEMNLVADVDELPFDKLPAAVQATFKAEGFGQKIEFAGKDMKFGVAIYETGVDHKGKRYELVVAEDGTLVEKVLVIDDEEIELDKCPTLVQAALKKQAGGGTIHDITKYAGIIKPLYEAEIEINGKIYLVEVSDTGYLVSKSLDADPE